MKLESTSFNLADYKAGKQTYGPPAETAPAQPSFKMPGDRLDVMRRSSDDYAERHAQAFGPKPPSQEKAPKIKLELGWKLDEMTEIALKPSLKKGGGLKIEFRKKF